MDMRGPVRIVPAIGTFVSVVTTLHATVLDTHMEGEMHLSNNDSS